jgi:hypothetical protein
MRQSGSNIPAGTYLPGKYKLTEDRKDKLLDVMNRLAQLSYEKGTRLSDQAIRERVKTLVGEVKQQYSKIKAFSSGKGGDAFALQDMLAFFNNQYLERFVLRELLDELRQEFKNLDTIDRAFEEKNPDIGYKRKLNIYRQNLERELGEWEKLLLHQVDPQLRGFLTEVNEIVLYNRIADRIDRLITSDDVFSRSGPVYQEFKESLASYAELHIKLARIPLTDADIIEFLNRILQQMGFRNTIMRARNVNTEIYGEIMIEIVSGSAMQQLVQQFSDTSRGALDAIRSREKSNEKPSSGKDLVKVLENLIYLEDATQMEMPSGICVASGLAARETDRYLFHAPGSFDISLKFVSEYMRDSMIFILDWLNKDTRKFPDMTVLLGPVIDCIPKIQMFVSFYKLALDEAANKSNQSGSGSKEKHFISKQIARSLIKSIQDNCTAIKHSLIDVSYGIMNSTLDRSGVLGKKMSVIKESCNDSHTKISKGLSEIPKV